MAVPVKAKAERRIVEHFLSVRAVSAADAIPYQASAGLPERRAFDRLKGSEVLRPAGRDRWYLDEQAWDRRKGFRRSRLAGAIVIATAVGVFAALRSR
ncbi:hypothetical protein WAB17_12505 [Parerythrobacter aurantius]|uniref:hypothetical protein n=1 Tax=Parerythrobacter aurantius TaxID=3127706 RepID=UPI003256451C